MVRRLVAALAAAVVVAVAVQADETPPPRPESKEQANAALRQEQLARQFREFEQALLQMAQRLEKSTKQSERDKAAVLRQAIAYANEKGVDNRFERLLGSLRKSDAIGLNDLREAMEQNQMVLADVRAILAILLSDDRDRQIKDEIIWLKDIIKALDGAIRDEKLVRAHIETDRMNGKELGQEQAKVTKATEGINAAIQKKMPDMPSDKNPGQHVQNAIGKQNQAQGKIDGNNPGGAAGDVNGAINDLARAREVFNRILQQLREEEARRLLATLKTRCEMMLKMQIAVREQTGDLDKVIGGRPDKAATRADTQKSLQLADREGEILHIANEAAKLLEEEGTAVAFAEVFTQLRQDMQTVQRRLGRSDVGVVTQAIEDDIIETLKEMIAALTKSINDTKPPENPPEPGPRDDRPPRLVDQLAELKMVRSMQVRVNTRTKTYGQQYQGEQADEASIRDELRGLADRQKKITQITQELGKPKE